MSTKPCHSVPHLHVSWTSLPLEVTPQIPWEQTCWISYFWDSTSSWEDSDRICTDALHSCSDHPFSRAQLSLDITCSSASPAHLHGLTTTQSSLTFPVFQKKQNSFLYLFLHFLSSDSVINTQTEKGLNKKHSTRTLEEENPCSL